MSDPHANDMVQRYRDAEKAILDGQTVQWGDKRLALPDLPEIRKGLRYWERRAEAAKGRAGHALANFSGWDE